MSQIRTYGGVLFAAVAVLASLLGYQAAEPDGVSAQTTLEVGAGVGSGTVAGNAFAPGEFTVTVGDSVRFEITSDEVHTVTFGAGPQGAPPPGWPATFPNEAPPGPPQPFDLGTMAYTGSEFVNTGIIFKGSTATVTFPNEGEFPFSCVIHPGMAGQVNVVATGGDATSQAEADAAADQTEQALLGQVNGLRQQAAAGVTQEKRADGTTLWSIPANTKSAPGLVAGGGTGYLELLEFTPANLEIKENDTVKWTASSPHTVTFLAPGQNPGQLGDPFVVEPTKPAPEYNPTQFFNSGPLAAGPPGSPATFELTFPAKGQYAYTCLIHGSVGHRGTINVSQPAPAGAPSTGGPPGDDGGGGGWLRLAVAVVAWAAFVAVAVAVSQRILGPNKQMA